LQSLIAKGETKFVFKFDNAPPQGGIFNEKGDLLEPLEDPAYGIVKSVNIIYNDGCNLNNIPIKALERELITIDVGKKIPPPTTPYSHQLKP